MTMRATSTLKKPYVVKNTTVKKYLNLLFTTTTIMMMMTESLFIWSLTMPPLVNAQKPYVICSSCHNDDIVLVLISLPPSTPITATTTLIITRDGNNFQSYSSLLLHSHLYPFIVFTLWFLSNPLNTQTPI